LRACGTILLVDLKKASSQFMCLASHTEWKNVLQRLGLAHASSGLLRVERLDVAVMQEVLTVVEVVGDVAVCVLPPEA